MCVKLKKKTPVVVCRTRWKYVFHVRYGPAERRYFLSRKRLAQYEFNSTRAFQYTAGDVYQHFNQLKKNIFQNFYPVQV